MSNKIISEDEYNKHSIDYLFNGHYDQNKSINIYQLAAIQYYNRGILLFNESKYRLSANNLEKAYLIYPSETIKFSWFAALANTLALENREKDYNGKTLAKYLNISIKNADALNTGEQFFNSVSNDLVIEHPHIDKYFKDEWEAVAVIENGETKKVNRHIKFKINARKNKTVDFFFGGLAYKGKWSIRAKSKLLYLIPERAKEKYLMFKVDSISENEIRLRYFRKDHFENRVYLLKLKQE